MSVVTFKAVEEREERVEQRPSVGRVVHYQSYGTPGGEYKSVARAAIITEELNDPIERFTVSLCVLSPTGMFFNRNVRYDPDGKPGTWRWPPRV